ncbi:MAG: Uma2 family endonuclease [Parvularculaceae bacterium]
MQPIRVTADAYVEMGALFAGRFEKTELLNGIIYEMPTDGPLTRLWNTVIAKFLHRSLADKYSVVSHQTLPLGAYWAPSPDHYVFETALGHDAVSGASVLLVVEVSDTTIAYDLGGKASAYASNGVREYWVVDANARKVFVHILSAGGIYGEAVEHGPDDRVAARFIPELEFCISDLFRDR